LFVQEKRELFLLFAKKNNKKTILLLTPYYI